MVPLARAVPAAIAEMLRRAPLSPGKVAFAWRATVGPAVDRVTAVHLESGSLLVDVETPEWAREVSRSSRTILGRLQAMLGEGVVERIEVRGRTSFEPAKHT